MSLAKGKSSAIICEVIANDFFNAIHAVGVAQSVRAPDCGSGGCGFEPRHPPSGRVVSFRPLNNR